MPSDQYGVPEQYDAGSNQGYSYERGALDESNQVQCLNATQNLESTGFEPASSPIIGK